MRVAVSGASGNIGAALLDALTRDSSIDEVVALARRPPAGAHRARVRWVAADITADDLRPAFDGADAVVHLAWAIQPSRNEAVQWHVNVVGSSRVFDAAAAARVGTVVYSSSVGAYSPGPKDRPVTEDWPTHGIGSSPYSRHKAYVERVLDAFEATHPDVRVVRIRPALVFQRRAASEVRRLFVGPFVPNALFRRIPVVPDVDRLVFQAVHACDVAHAFHLALVTPGFAGPCNVAADPIIDATVLAEALHATRVPLPGAALRVATSLAWHAHLFAGDPGWVDLALRTPTMDTTRARTELGWRETASSVDALLELLGGLADGAGGQTPTLRSDASGPGRFREVVTGIGASQGTSQEERRTEAGA